MPTNLPTVRVRTRTRTSAPADCAVPFDKSLALKIAYVPIATVRESVRNARTHGPKQIAKIAASLQQFGFVNPILVDEEWEIIAGHGRVAAARQLGLTEIPTITLGHMTEAEKRAYRIADNKLAELAGWDASILKVEFVDLASVDMDLPEITGFDTAEIDIIIDDGSSTVSKADPADVVPEQDGSCAISRVGDLWLLGEHRVICGDARDAHVYERLLGGELAQMVFTDPPYNCAIAGHVSGLGKTQHREFVMASGEMSRPEFLGFLTAVLRCLADASADGSLHLTCMDWRELHTLLSAGQEVYDELKNIVCWAKTNGGMGSLYRSQHELIPVWKKGRAPHINNVELGRFGRYRTNVWTYAGVNTFRRGRMDELAAHPTVKPVALIADAIKDASKPQGIILDAFGGSGTTLIAAAKTRRRGYLVELDPSYVDVSVRRWEALFKGEARHAETGLTFAETAAERGCGIGAVDGETGHDA